MIELISVVGQQLPRDPKTIPIPEFVSNDEDDLDVTDTQTIDGVVAEEGEIHLPAFSFQVGTAVQE